MNKKEPKEVMNELIDEASTDMDIFHGKITPDTLFDFILAATTYGGWKKPLELRDYQMRPAWDIIDSVLNKRGNEITAMFSRQSGKTTSISGATNFFLTSLPSFYIPLKGVGVRSGIFGPKKEQADYAFDMYKSFIETGFIQDYLGTNVVLSNSREVRLTNGSRCHCESASKNASIERLTLDIAILEEAQNIDDTRILNSIYPMCASTNGTRVLIGTPTPDRSGYFYKLTGRRGTHNHRADWRECARFSKHYDSFVQKEMRRHGPTSDYFKTQYELEWTHNVINMCTLDELTMCKNGPFIYSSDETAFAGLDTGRINDSTVLTIILGVSNFREKPHIALWAEWQGDDYPTQAKDITQILSNFTNLKLLNVDVHTIAGGSYGITDLLPPNIPIAAVPMKSDIQSQMWGYVRKAIKQQEFTYPEAQETERYKFEEQLTMLRTSHVGGLIKASAPAGQHDDFADSFALAWYPIAELYYISSDNIPSHISNLPSEEKTESKKQKIRPQIGARKMRLNKPKPTKNRFSGR